MVFLRASEIMFALLAGPLHQLLTGVFLLGADSLLLASLLFADTLLLIPLLVAEALLQLTLSSLLVARPDLLIAHSFALILGAEPCLLLAGPPLIGEPQCSHFRFSSALTGQCLALFARVRTRIAIRHLRAHRRGKARDGYGGKKSETTDPDHDILLGGPVLLPV
jgi:hypothetical protein